MLSPISKFESLLGDNGGSSSYVASRELFVLFLFSCLTQLCLNVYRCQLRDRLQCCRCFLRTHWRDGGICQDGEKSSCIAIEKETSYDIHTSSLLSCQINIMGAIAIWALKITKTRPRSITFICMIDLACAVTNS